MSDDEQVCWIESAADPTTGKPLCLISWGNLTRVEISIEQTLATARELTAAAVAAETDKALVEEFTSKTGVGMDLQLAGLVLTKVRERRTTMMQNTGVRPWLRIQAVYGARTKLPLVHFSRGSMSGELTPDEARQMGQHWTETAIGATLDARTRYVLAGEYGFDHVKIDEFFHHMIELNR
jgi:hypothetical protein